MGIDIQIDSARRRVNRLAPVLSPPELTVHVYKEGEKNPTSGSQWELSIMIENKKEDDLGK